MKTKLLFTLSVCILFSNLSLYAQSDELPKSDSSKFAGGAVIGSVTIDGKTYQQFALRADVPIGKFGFGVDLQLLFDEKGQIRKEDWDQWQDYMDKIYYIRYGKKNDPFYIRIGGLDYTYIGYANIVNGYSNMVQYPSRKRYGGELSFYIPSEKLGGKPRLGAELFFNDVKEVIVESPVKPAIVFGSRVYYRPIRHFELGVSLAGDLNEYNAFQDKDGDGVPDAIDLYSSNKNWATEMDRLFPLTNNVNADLDYLLADSHWGANPTERMQKLIELGMIPSDTSRMRGLFNLHNQSSKMYAASVDVGIPIIEREKIKLDIYSHFTQLKGENRTYGWGAALPGVRLIVGAGNVNTFLTFKAEYRRSSKEFLFGYFNNTYELERAQFIGNKQVVTKQQQLLAIQDAYNGVYASAELNFFGYITSYASYQDLKGANSDHMRSIHGELRMGETLKKMIHFADVNGYYIQNNVQDFRELRTPSSIMGYTVGYNYKGAIMGIDYRWTFQDLNGNGLIRGSKEVFKTISFRTAVSF